MFVYRWITEKFIFLVCVLPFSLCLRSSLNVFFGWHKPVCFFFVGPSALNTENPSVRWSFSETSQPIRFERVVRNRCDVGLSENKREVSVWITCARHKNVRLWKCHALMNDWRSEDNADYSRMGLRSSRPITECFSDARSGKLNQGTSNIEKRNSGN